MFFIWRNRLIISCLVYVKIPTNKIETFSIDNQIKNMMNYLSKIKILCTNHNEYLISDSEILDTIENINHVYSEPFADSSQYLQYYCQKELRKSHCCLTGMGEMNCLWVQ